jgi:hypothetical protein
MGKYGIAAIAALCALTVGEAVAQESDSAKIDSPSWITLGLGSSALYKQHSSIFNSDFVISSLAFQLSVNIGWENNLISLQWTGASYSITNPRLKETRYDFIGGNRPEDSNGDFGILYGRSKAFEKCQITGFLGIGIASIVRTTGYNSVPGFFTSGKPITQNETPVSLLLAFSLLAPISAHNGSELRLFADINSERPFWGFTYGWALGVFNTANSQTRNSGG